MKAYFYCRVAHDDSFSLERQAEELRRYAEQAGYTIVGAAAEHGSGMTLDRPALQEVMEAVLAGKVDVVLISSLDRIGRDWGMTKQYIALLTEHKVKLLCVRERAGTDDDRQLQLFTILHIKKQSVHYRILRSYKDTLHGPSVIIGSQKTQIYQRFSGSLQEVFILKILKFENNAAQQDNGRHYHNRWEGCLPIELIHWLV